MIKIYILFLAAFCILFDSSWYTSVRKNKPAVKQKVEWLKGHLTPVRSINPDDEDFSDLSGFHEAISEARIVMLGEQSHGDGTTFLAKTRLIKFLHQRCGFDILAFESGLYDCHKAWESLQKGTDPEKAVKMGVFGIWTQSRQVQPLMRYLGSAVKTSRPLELAGFDCQFTGAASDELLLAEIEELAEKVEANFSRKDWAVFKEALQASIENSPNYRPSSEKRNTCMSVLSQLELAVETYMQNIDAQDRELLFWKQVLRGIKIQLPDQWKGEFSDDGTRDAQMAENLLWLAHTYYPDRKIIVWAATGHIAYNPDLVGMNTKSMGHYVRQDMGKAVYALGFTAYEGIASPSVFWIRLAHPRWGSFEDLIFLTGLDYAILDFRAIPPGGEWLREKRYCRPMGYSEDKAQWPEILDGLMYTRKMEPSIPCP